MPNAFEPVAAGPDDYRSGLSPCGSVPEGSQIVAHSLETVKQIIQVLYLCNRPEAAKCHANTLTQDGRFPDTGI